MNLKKSHIVILLVAALLLGAAGSYFGIQLAQSEPDTKSESEQKVERFADLSESEQKKLLENFAAGSDNNNASGDMKKVEQAYNVIKENYVEEVDDKQLMEGAIQGMLETLDDPYSVYMDKETMEQFDQSIESSFEGIGAEVSMVDGKVTIVGPIKGSPAEEAGLKPNDQILAVDGESVEGLDLYETVLQIRGEKGTEVTLTIQRPGVSDPVSIDIVRDDIPLETVYSEIKEKDGKKAGVIEITSFSEKTSDEFKEALSELEGKGMEGLIIDVRGNPGGLFTDVQEILQNFIPEDVPYVQVEDKNGEKERYFSKMKDKKEYPVTVLMDEGSASASEILAAAMQEAGGYELVGEKTFGKGTVQQAIPMGDGSTIKITLYKWLTPDGNWIHEKGVQPTVKVKQPAYFYTNPVEIEEPLEYDQNNDKIKNIQVMLDGLGYDVDRSDGYFDKKTEEAVKQFQEDENLKVTGAIDQKTGGSIEAKIVDLIREGKNDKQMEKALDVLFQQ
ncbi:peptidase S41 [Thalassobacillus devorans]|uniref:Peptidase S41 n=1 Tax=Thalassobacillus devorans TaxID=279813 RepID=A0ABQ1NTZ7_9BACI|nr:S41 family peptidase [Thalassobacillus devorans]NIK28882.1 carboxyl-terminal processing protease [Thalassobacillus devorans]GGC82874.1 peptidase S41 [Thalassobacillus devorans]